ncbi:MAG: hypothetical protein RSE93_06095 [Oscillospiraceae bacterium]
MAELTLELEQFEKGDFLCWEVLTQCQNTCTVTLQSGGTNYFTCNKNNSSTNLQVLAQSSSSHSSTNVPKLTISVPQASRLQQSLISGAVNDSRARKVGYSYSVCIEDSNDDDYNDVYVNIVGWKNKG